MSDETNCYNSHVVCQYVELAVSIVVAKLVLPSRESPLHCMYCRYLLGNFIGLHISSCTMLVQHPNLKADPEMRSNFDSKFPNRVVAPIAPSSSTSSRVLLPSVNNSLGSGSSSSSGTYSLFSSPRPSKSSYHGGMHSGSIDGSIHPNAGPRVVGGTMDPLEAVLGIFPCARLRGLPFDASLEDVLVFFQGLVVLDVVVVGNSYGHGSGEAFVVFANPMDWQMALQR